MCQSFQFCTILNKSTSIPLHKLASCCQQATFGLLAIPIQPTGVSTASIQEVNGKVRNQNHSARKSKISAFILKKGFVVLLFCRGALWCLPQQLLVQWLANQGKNILLVVLGLRCRLQFVCSRARLLQQVAMRSGRNKVWGIPQQEIDATFVSSWWVVQILTAESLLYFVMYL